MSDAPAPGFESSRLPAEGGRVPPDELPPVEPPSANFIVQLFVVPALIVLVVVMVYVLFGTIAAQQSDPQQYLISLAQGNAERRWRAAHGLAQALESDADLANDERLALQLADLLDRELQQGATNNADRMLRAYLATALGKFNVPVGVPLLRKAMAGSQPTEVRIRAIGALADLAQRTADLEDPNVVPDLIAASKDSEPVVRKFSAFTMGVLNEPRFTERLTAMLHDADADSRYNAALALARNGDAAAVPVLAAMLDPGSAEGIQEEQDSQRSYKESLVLLNALKATDLLLAANAEADLSPLASPLERLTHHDLQKVRLTALDVLRKLQARAERRNAPQSHGDTEKGAIEENRRIASPFDWWIARLVSDKRVARCFQRVVGTFFPVLGASVSPW